ncbi:unnamed protein product, partial [Ascophyllum nodosum]
TREEFSEAFRAIGRKNDGNVHVRDFKQLLVVTGPSLTDQHLEEIFHGLDEDGSGRVNYRELIDYMLVV